MNLTKEQILGASDEQLNELCATKILGYTLEHPQIRDARYRDSQGTFMGMRFNYTPTTNVGQAVDLLDKLAEQGFWSYVFTKPNLPYKVQIGKHHEEGYCEDKSRSKAIVIASLLAIVAMEEA